MEQMCRPFGALLTLPGRLGLTLSFGRSPLEAKMSMSSCMIRFVGSMMSLRVHDHADTLCFSKRVARSLKCATDSIGRRILRPRLKEDAR